MFDSLPVSSVLYTQQQSYPFRDRQHAPLLGAPPVANELVDAFAGMPSWVRALLAARNRIVRRLGLDAGVAKPVRAGATNWQVGDQFSVFRILAMQAHEVVLGLDDRHLDFRVAIQVEQETLHVSTLVKPHNIAGWLYLAAVTPAHLLIARLSVRRMARELASG